MHRGIDVSSWQGTVNWDAVKKAGVEFVIIRAGYGQNNIDKQFVRNITECNRLEIPCGVYWFSYALNPEMAKQEARYCLQAIAPYRVEYPVAFDFEYESVNYAKKKGIVITRELATDIAKAFLDEVARAGYYPMLYTNRDYLVNVFIMDKLSGYDIWYARYSAKLDRKDVGIWQYTSSGTVDGISGRVDMNIAYKDYPTIIRQMGLNKLRNLELPSRAESDHGVAREVNTLKRGDRGAEVKKVQELLLSLGYQLPKYGADGSFGAETEAAVNAFKKAVNLPQDGVVDVKTLLAMFEAVTKKLEQRLQQAKSFAEKIMGV